MYEPAIAGLLTGVLVLWAVYNLFNRKTKQQKPEPEPSSVPVDSKPNIVFPMLLRSMDRAYKVSIFDGATLLREITCCGASYSLITDKGKPTHLYVYRSIGYRNEEEYEDGWLASIDRYIDIVVPAVHQVQVEKLSTTENPSVAA